MAEKDINWDNVFDGAEEQGAAEPVESQEKVDEEPKEESKDESEGKTTEEQEEQSTDNKDEAEQAEGEKEQKPTKPAQSDADNAKYAAARRKAEHERDIAIDETRRNARAEMDREIANLGLENPYTGKNVESLEDLKAYNESLLNDQREEIDERFRDSGLSEEDIDTLVSLHPDVRAARQTKKEYEAIKEEIEKKKLGELFDSELGKITELDPDIKTAEDLFTHPKADEIKEYISKGYTIEDAYRKANREELEQKNYARIKQDVLNKISGKSHLQGTVAHGKGEANVPQDVMRTFRAIMPNKSDEEIRQFYAKDLRRMNK